MPSKISTIELKASDFCKISDILYNTSGINLDDNKQELVKSRLMKRINELEFTSFEQYLNFIKQDFSKKELFSMIDMLTTNVTFFFREQKHFNFLAESLKSGNNAKKIRIWCAGCSSGAEPYSTVIKLNEEYGNLNKIDLKILGTDISSKMIEKARTGIYDEAALKGVDNYIIDKYFIKQTEIPNYQSNIKYSIKSGIKEYVNFARLNLMDEWPMNGPFDYIFCRNVMIYFDKFTQNKLVNRFYSLLAEGGYLFIGHSESLSGLKHNFKYVEPAIYLK